MRPTKLPDGWAIRESEIAGFRIVDHGTVIDGRPTYERALRRALEIIQQRNRLKKGKP